VTIWHTLNTYELQYKIKFIFTVKSTSISRNAHYHSVQNLLSPRVLPGNLKSKMQINIILPVVFYGYETWSAIVRREHILRVPENKVLWTIPRPKGK